MAEISREESIKFLKAHSECEKKKVKGIYEVCNEDLCYECDLCYAQGNWGEHIDATDKAISDMQKLEKIERAMSQTETMKLNGWTLEETVEMATQLMQKEGNMLVWDTLRHLRDYVEWYKDEIEHIVKEV